MGIYALCMNVLPMKPVRIDTRVALWHAKCMCPDAHRSIAMFAKALATLSECKVEMMDTGAAQCVRSQQCPMLPMSQ